MIENIKKYFNGVVTETKKVTWPTRKQVINHTILVVVAMLLMMGVFGIIDMGFSKLLEFFITRS